MVQMLGSPVNLRRTQSRRLSGIAPEKHRDEVDDSTGSHTQPIAWTPVSLRVISLLGFILLFSALGLSLILIRSLAKRTDGFDLFLDNHYIWVYGPTALLILIISLWRQLDYNCKIIAPWHGLTHGSQKASKSIFLDYISPLQVVALYQAVINGHIAVALATLGFFTLKLITIASTGLLVMSFVHVTTSSQDLLTTMRFNYPRIGDALSGSNLTSPVYRAYGYLIKGMPFADGVTAKTAYQSVTMPYGTKSANVTYSADVQSLSPSFKCQQLQMFFEDMVDSDPTALTVRLNLTYSAPCNISSTYGGVCYPESHRCASSQYLFSREVTDCGHEGETWWLISNTQWIFNQTLNGTDLDAAIGDTVNPEDWSFDIGNYSSWACKLEQNMQTARVTYDTSQSPPTIDVLTLNQATSPKFPGFTPANLSAEVLQAFDNAGKMLGGRDLLLGMSQDFVGGTNATFIQDPDTLGPVLETVFAQIAGEVISQVAMQHTVTKIPGSIVTVQARLQVSELVLSFMGGGFIMMILITGGILWTRPTHTQFPIRLDTIKMVAGVVSGRGSFHQLLSYHHAERESAVVKSLQDSHCSFSYRSHETTQSGEINVIGNDMQTSPCTSRNEAVRAWWTPLTLTKPILCFTMLAPLLTIGLLEFLQRRSDHAHGFVAINSSTSTLIESFFARFAPALIMLLIATLFTSLDFNAAVLAPFNSLTAEHPSSYKIISSTVLGKTSPLALLIALEQKQWSAAFAATGAFIGSVLTIVVSGLYTIDLVPDMKHISLNKQDSFRLEWNNSVLDDGGAAVMLSMIEGANLTYPSLTYDGLVFPNLTAVLDGQDVPASGSGLIEVTVPALRANLDCQTFESTLDFNVTFTVITKIDNWSFLTEMAYPLPSSCLRGGPFGNKSALDFTFSQQFPTSNAGMWYYAGLLDLHVGPYDEITGNPAGEILPEQNPDNPPGCPTLSFNYGWADTSRNLTSSRLMVCNQQIQQVETSLTLTYPNMTIPDAHPPVPNEQVVSTLSSGPDNTTAFPFRIQKSLKDSFSLFNPSSAYSSTKDKLKFDNFFLGVMFGKDNLDFSVFTDDTFQEQLLPAMQTFYRRYMAQVMNAKMRSAQAVRSDNSSNFAATLALDSGVPRMFQHETPKTILQVMLGLMFISGALSLQLGRFHKIVPWNPCSLAGTSVLFAGSRICREEKRPGLLRRTTTGSTVTEIEDTDEGTPLIGSNRDTQLNNQGSIKDTNDSSTPPANSLWGSFSAQDRAIRAQKRVEQSQPQPYDIRTARLRLGWWKNGVFFGEQGPSKQEIQEDHESGDEIWRYGIDYLPSSTYNATRCHCGNHTCHT